MRTGFHTTSHILLLVLAAIAALTHVTEAAPPPASPAIAIKDTFNFSAPGAVRLEGWLGGRLDACIQHRVWAQESEQFIAPLRDHTDNNNWRGEYWGKWFTAAVLAEACRPAAARRAQLERIARDVVKAQAPDGYLGSSDAKHHLANWDVWCRKYVLLGLITAYDFTSDPAFLDAARRDADNLIAEAERKKNKVIEVATPVLKGTADSSIIEPLALLYQRTGDARYLEFARAIIALWNGPTKSAPQGIHLLEDALAGKPPLKNHAYSIMSCFEGICELYRATGERPYLDAAVRFGQAIRQHERMIDGSVSNQELFCGGAATQTEFLEQPQETCATVTWIKLCAQLLRLTGDPVWADEMELSLYNAMAGAMTPGGEWFSYHSPLTGERVPSHMQQTDVQMSCCVASGPRGLLLTPRWAVMSSAEGPVVNLYAPGSAEVNLAGGPAVKLTQATDYPAGDEIKMTVSPERTARFALRLRIPAWSKQTTLTLNGQPVPCTPGTYARLEREWAPGDQLRLRLDLRGRALPAPSGAPQLAVMRGPILLALDSRLTQPQDLAVRLVTDDEGCVALKPLTTTPEGIWLAFEAPFEVRPSHFFNHRRLALAMCDFASAGNQWSAQNLYRTWLPQPLLLRQAFAPGTWKIMYPETQARPEIPSSRKIN